MPSMRMNVIGKVSSNSHSGRTNNSSRVGGNSSTSRVSAPNRIDEELSLSSSETKLLQSGSHNRIVTAACSVAATPAAHRSNYGSSQGGATSSSINWSGSEPINGAAISADQDGSSATTTGVASTTPLPLPPQSQSQNVASLAPTTAQQLLFMDWNFVSPTVLLEEDASVLKKRRGGFITRVLGNTNKGQGSNYHWDHKADGGNSSDTRQKSGGRSVATNSLGPRV